MSVEINGHIFLVGLAIFVARIFDVSLGTLRTISLVHGRQWMSFWLGLFEIIIWITVVSTVIHQIKEFPVLAFFYALGFASGNLVGIKLESMLALGCTNLKIICRKNSEEIARAVREAGYAVTTFHGDGKTGPVVELYIICRRRNLKTLLGIVHKIQPDVFYTTEHIAYVNRVCGPIFQPVTGWRSVLKKK